MNLQEWVSCKALTSGMTGWQTNCSTIDMTTSIEIIVLDALMLLIRSSDFTFNFTNISHVLNRLVNPFSFSRAKMNVNKINFILLSQ